MADGDIVLERRYRAGIAAVWALWTTAKGIERWWGPQGFGVTVQSIDLRAGGELVYLMEARAPEMVDFMLKNGMPTATRTTLRYTEVAAPNRLGFTSLVDFVPGHPAYETHGLLELVQDGDEVALRLTTGRMHDDLWTDRARKGWLQELDKLAALLLA